MDETRQAPPSSGHICRSATHKLAPRPSLVLRRDACVVLRRRTAADRGSRCPLVSGPALRILFPRKDVPSGLAAGKGGAG